MDQVEADDESGFWIPSSTLSRGRRGLWSVLVLQPADDGKQKAQKRDVEVLHTSGDRALVRGTLDDGDVVIASGAHRVAPGQAVVAVAK